MTMAYTSDGIKKNYENQCKKQRTKNLIKLRVDIAKMPKQVDFQRIMGFTKSDLSNLENGDKPLSLFHIHAYKTYFRDNFNLDVSTDFLLGYTDIIKNESMDIAKDLGLSDNLIAVLKGMSEQKNLVLNKLAENNLLDLLLTELWIYATNSTYVDIQIKNNITGGIEQITNPDEIEKMMKFRANDSFNLILYFIKKAFSNNVDQAIQNKNNLLETERQILNSKQKMDNAKSHNDHDVMERK